MHLDTGQRKKSFEYDPAKTKGVSMSIGIYCLSANLSFMSKQDDSSFKSALIGAAGDLVKNPVIGPVIEQVAYDFLSSPECRDAFAAYAARRLKEKVGLTG